MASYKSAKSLLSKLALVTVTGSFINLNFFYYILNMNFIRLKIILGYLGFLPFAFFTILPMIFGEVLAIWSLQILSIYGGIILSFLAGE